MLSWHAPSGAASLFKRSSDRPRFPANVHAARQALTIGGSPATPLVLRTALQIVFLAAVLAAGFGRTPGGPRPS
jgi:hypothetical protein